MMGACRMRRLSPLSTTRCCVMPPKDLADLRAITCGTVRVGGVRYA